MARRSVALLAVLGLAALTACSGPATTPPKLSGTACRSTPAGHAADVGRATADRGIGGTGQMAERGIGGTGIVGTITGFGSVCVDGVEVGIDPAAPVLMDGTPQTAASLSIGQVAAIAAETTPEGLQARSLSVRHEVTGPVQSVGAGRLVVAGQRVRSNQPSPQLGSWVTISGLRDPEGIIHASRIDPAGPGLVPGLVIVSGPLTREAGVARIDTLRLRGGGTLPAAGTPVTVSGQLQAGALAVRTLTIDPVLPDRTSLAHFLIETYARREGNALVLGSGLRATLGPGFKPLDPNRRVVLILEVGPQGGLIATGQVRIGNERGVRSNGAGAAHGGAPAPDGPAAPAGAPDRNGAGGDNPDGGQGTGGEDTSASAFPMSEERAARGGRWG